MTKCLKVSGHSKYRHSTKFPAPTPKLPPNTKTHSLPVNTIMDWNPIIRFALKIKIAARTLDEDSFFNCFEDVISLLNVCEEGENSTSRPFIEKVINCLESAVKFVENVLPIVNDCKGELTEVAGNLRVLFHSWCQKLTELGLRNTPNCTHLAVYLVTSLELTVNWEPERPKYEIDEETLLHFRALGYKWKEIAEIQILMIVCKHSWTYKEALWGIQWFEATWEVWVLMFKENVFEPVFHELIRSTAVCDGQQCFLQELIQCQALTVYGILTAITVWLRGVSL